jgi:valyl-tRNA synthetase
VSDTVERPALATTQIIGNTEIYLIGVVDPDKERERLEKQRLKLKKESEKAKAKLSNDNFVRKAPSEVVEAEKKKLSELQTQIELVDKSLRALDES